MVKKKVVKKEGGKAQSNSVVGFLSKLKKLYFHPNVFLKSVEGEKNYWPLLRTFLLFYIFYLFVAIIINLSFVNFQTDYLAQLILFVFSIGLTLVFIFGISGVIHLGIRIFKGKQGYFNIYKPIIYTATIFIIYTLITILVFRLIPYEAVPTEILNTTQDLETVKQIYNDFLSQTGAMVAFIISIISVIHAIIFLVMGISKFQKMTKTKVVFALILSALVLFVVFILINLALIYLSGQVVG